MYQLTIKSSVAEVKDYFLTLQQTICDALADEDGAAAFHKEPWLMPSLGSGITQTLADGSAFEKAGVNFSHVHGNKLPIAATDKRPDLQGCRFQALGVSLVIHPANPYVPASHANVRLFIAEKPDADPVWWFGGGFDLTPYYGFAEDAEHWHRIAKMACDPFGADIYQRYKTGCDDYFYLKHRQEQRGIGGLFFDDLNEWGFATCFDFVKSIGDHYLPAYRPLVAQHKYQSFGLREKNFQLFRRGRYVEFNLLYDRGTLFGLQTNARPEAVLMSLPPHCSWEYNWHPEPDSAEARLYTDFLVRKDWLNIKK